MSGNRSHYDILDVAVDANISEIKKAYFRLARQYHPDKHPGDNAAKEKFQDIAEAYRVLSDDALRSAHDEELKKEEVDVFEVVEEQDMHEPEPSDTTEPSKILVVTSAYKFEDIVADADLSPGAEFMFRLKDKTLTKQIFESSYDSFDFYHVSENESLANELIETNKFTYPENLTLAMKFASSCELLLQKENFVNSLSYKEAYDLSLKYFDNQTIQQIIQSLPDLARKINAYRESLTTNFEEALKVDNEQNRRAIAAWLIKHNIQGDELVKLANHLMVAHVILDNDILARRLIPSRLILRPDLVNVGLLHEEIALRLVGLEQYRNLLKEECVEFGSPGGNKSSAFYLAVKFTSVRQALLGNQYWMQQLPITEIMKLYSDAELNESITATNRKRAYQDLQTLSNYDENHIESLIMRAKFRSQELANIAPSQPLLMRFILAKEPYKAWLGGRLENIGRKNEEFAIELVKDHKNKRFLDNDSFGLYFGLGKWKSVCRIVLNDPHFAKMLHGNTLLEMENTHGSEISDLILKAGLQRKLFAAALLEKAANQEGGFNTKKSTCYSKKQDEAEIFYRRALQLEDKPTMAVGYLLRAANLKHRAALGKLVVLAKKPNNISEVLPVIELCWLRGEEEAANELFVVIQNLVRNGDMLEFLGLVQSRIDLLTDQPALPTIGNGYFAIIDTLLENHDLQRAEEYHSALRYLASLFAANEPTIAQTYLSRIPDAAHTLDDLFNLADFAWRAVEEQQRNAILEAQPTLAAEEFDPLMKRAERIVARYQASLPFYLRAAATGDGAAVSAANRRLDELCKLNVDEAEKQQLLLMMGWGVRGSLLAWQRAASGGNQIAVYLLAHRQELKEGDFFTDALRLISDKFLVDALPLLDRILRLPDVQRKEQQEQFMDILSNNVVSIEVLSAVGVVLTEVEEEIRKQAAERVRQLKEQEECEAAERARKIQEKQARKEENDKSYSAFQAFANTLTSKIATVRENASQFRIENNQESAVYYDVKANIIERVVGMLKAKIEQHYTDEVKTGEILVDKNKLRTEMIEIINNDLANVSSQLQEHASWYTLLTYQIMKALYCLFPCSLSIEHRLFAYEDSFIAMPSHQTDNLISSLRAM